MSVLPSGAGTISRLNAVILGESLASEEDDLVFPSPDFTKQALVSSPEQVIRLTSTFDAVLTLFRLSFSAVPGKLRSSVMPLLFSRLCSGGLVHENVREVDRGPFWLLVGDGVGVLLETKVGNGSVLGKFGCAERQSEHRGKVNQPCSACSYFITFRWMRSSLMLFSFFVSCRLFLSCFHSLSKFLKVFQSLMV